jgi:hypothetical protein
LAQNPIRGMVAQRLARWNAQHPNHQVDLKALEAVGGQEGYSGRIGDSGHAFGPFQLNNAGGVITGRFPGQSPQQIQQWATSPQGIDFALSKIGGVAGGLQGPAAVRAIVSRFERPADIPGEIARALGTYGGASAAELAPQPAAAAGSTPPQPSQLPQLLRSISGAEGGDYTGFYGQLGKTLQAQRAGAAQGAPAVAQLGAEPRAPVKGFKPGVPVADLTSRGAEHPTMGLAGYPAYDYFAPSGSPAVAPVTGKVVRLSGHDPRQGPVQGPHGPLGWSVYIQGSDGHEYFLTHMGSRNVKVGQTVKAGQPIGTVADYSKYGTPSHIHMGVR